MSLAKKLIYPHNLKRIILALVLVIAIATITMGAMYDAAVKTVTVSRIDAVAGTEDTVEYVTRQSTVSEFLTENNIIIGGYEVLNRNPETELYNNDKLIIRQGRQIELTADGNTTFAITTQKTVKEALEEANLILTQTDVVTPSADTVIENGMTVVVDRYVTEDMKEIVPVEFKTTRVHDSTLKKGETKVVSEGANGEKEITYSVTKKNGEIISKEYKSEKVIKEAQNKVIHVGVPAKPTAQQAAVTGKTDSFTYVKKIDMEATAYGTSLAENGGYSRTAYGLTPQYGVVAVDPRVIPLGTKLYVESPDGGKSWSYGYCIAGDTGGAIKGNRIDLCFNYDSECTRFGRKRATVYVLE